MFWIPASWIVTVVQNAFPWIQWFFVDNEIRQNMRTNIANGSHMNISVAFAKMSTLVNPATSAFIKTAKKSCNQFRR
jgi:hypothetical protein